MTTRRSVLASIGLAVLGLATRGVRALPRVLAAPDRPVVVRGVTRVLLLPRAFVDTYRPRIWVRGKRTGE
jgi:hypothetical protein